MNKITKLIVVSVALVGFTFNLSAHEKVEKQNSTSEQFLSFILTKAEKYSENVEEGISKAVDVISEETPKVVEEFLAWRAWRAGIIGFGCLAFTVLGGGGLVYLFHKKGFWEVFPVPLLFLFPITFGFIYTLEFVQIMVAPRVYIIEQAIELVK